MQFCRSILSISDVMNLADKLVAVNYLGVGILERWHKMLVKLALTGDGKKKKVPVLQDPRWAKPIAAFTKKFPEFMPDLEKVSAFLLPRAI